MTTSTGYRGLDPAPAIAAGVPGLVAWIQKAVKVVNLILLGKLNACTTVTLTANVATTVLTDPRLSGTSRLFFGPQTANAKAEGTPWYDTRGEGTVTLHHANNAQVDRTYDVLIIG